MMFSSTGSLIQSQTDKYWEQDGMMQITLLWLAEVFCYPFNVFSCWKKGLKFNGKNVTIMGHTCGSSTGRDRKCFKSSG